MTRLAVALTTLAFAASPALASTWKNDPAHSKASFSATHMMISTVHGELGLVTSTLELDDKDLTKSKVEATIDVAKIHTGIEKRDAHLRSNDFFNAEKFPALTFKSKKFEKAGDKFKVTGDLTIRDQTHEVVLEASITPEVTNPFSKATARGVVATGTINREQWGLTWNMPVGGDGVLVSKAIKIELEVEFVKDAPKT